MGDDRVCELNDKCECTPDERDGCARFHMPMPRFISKRSTKQTDFVDRGVDRIRKSSRLSRDKQSDIHRQYKEKLKQVLS